MHARLLEMKRNFDQLLAKYEEAPALTSQTDCHADVATAIVELRDELGELQRKVSGINETAGDAHKQAAGQSVPRAPSNDQLQARPATSLPAQLAADPAKSHNTRVMRSAARAASKRVATQLAATQLAATSARALPKPVATKLVAPKLVATQPATGGPATAQPAATQSTVAPPVAALPAENATSAARSASFTAPKTDKLQTMAIDIGDTCKRPPVEEPTVDDWAHFLSFYNRVNAAHNQAASCSSRCDVARPSPSP